jgi:hypothetical protein
VERFEVRFEVQRGEPFDQPENWKPAGEAEATGEQEEAAVHAVHSLAGKTGWYRTRVAGQPGDTWIYCDVRVNGQTGEKEITWGEEPPS